MAEKLEDLTLPNGSVQKIIKEALPDNTNVGKDARLALSRAASVFVLYVTSQASNEAQKVNRKTLTKEDVINALKDLEFEDFIEPLQIALKEFKEAKAKKTVNKSIEGTTQNGTEHSEGEDDDADGNDEATED
ncbi:unnamed protein product [Acanthoscelides obtectus]|uniref:DNA polymerase epsilon subunit 3 n=1 Tax=Acanthoscelides obtectus TaxID=200917 RepID=A0A9P0LGN6_ACAOB|nr:unnamed protein product [Acanthoscelides obtectus]CAK1650075.1 DNA polymerase epsilon subunit 3 [Acanthoscelides obtectus]